MPDDVTTDHAPETDLEEEEVVLVHDDIVKRLLDYQRQLREADESTGPEQEASVTAVGTVVELEEIVDLTVVETELEATEDGAGDRDAEVIDIWSDRSDGADAAAAELAVVPDEPALETFGATSASEPTPEMSGVEASVTPAEVEARIERIEASLERLSDRFAELRSSFQDMAIAADERLAEIDQLIADIRRER
jgi:hypothetical protein